MPESPLWSRRPPNTSKKGSTRPPVVDQPQGRIGRGAGKGGSNGNGGGNGSGNGGGFSNGNILNTGLLEHRWESIGLVPVEEEGGRMDAAGGTVQTHAPAATPVTPAAPATDDAPRRRNWHLVATGIVGLVALIVTVGFAAPGLLHKEDQAPVSVALPPPTERSDATRFAPATPTESRQLVAQLPSPTRTAVALPTSSPTVAVMVTVTPVATATATPLPPAPTDTPAPSATSTPAALMPTPTRAAPRPAPTRRVNTYTVRPGDSLYAIAWRFGTTVDALARANGLRPYSIIYPGQVLAIP